MKENLMDDVDEHGRLMVSVPNLKLPIAIANYATAKGMACHLERIAFRSGHVLVLDPCLLEWDPELEEWCIGPDLALVWLYYRVNGIPRSTPTVKPDPLKMSVQDIKDRLDELDLLAMAFGVERQRLAAELSNRLESDDRD